MPWRKRRTYRVAARRKKKQPSKKNQTRKTRLMKLGAALVVVCAVIAGSWFLGRSSFFSLREVEVYGNKYLSEKEMAKMMGIQPGENLIELPSKEVAGMLLDSKWVKSVSLRKEYPGKLLVRIEEAVPQALLQVRDNVYFVDGEGNVLEKLKSAPVQFLPVIVSDSARNPNTFKEAVNLAGVIKERGLAAEKDRIEITGVEKGPENLTMNIDGLTAKVGQGDYDEKLRRLFELSDEIRKRHISVKYIDLRFANSVIVKPFKEAME
jgi:cell division protein FtsQ